VIFGCLGAALTAEERAFFRATDPLGFILFKRNCISPEQIRALTDSFRELSGRADIPVLIDQEGGRVARLSSPPWYKAPAAARFAELFGDDKHAAAQAVRLNSRLIAHDLVGLGISVDCLPVLDVPASDGHQIIGDRAYGTDPKVVADLGLAAAQGLLDFGVLPVMKHIPGHGRARSDTHQALPHVEAGRRALEEIDFKPFAVLHDLPLAMTAHVVFDAIDPLHPATLSGAVIEQVIRGYIGFDGLLMSDDLSMKALSGSFEKRAAEALDAGCDVVLHCNGEMEEMKAVMQGVSEMSQKAGERAEKALHFADSRKNLFDVEESRASLSALLAGRGIAASM